MISNSFIEQYKQIFRNDGIEKAKEYKNCFLKKEKIYKFVWLDDISRCHQECNRVELNESKINSLQNRQIWFSTYKNFNDPFELASTYINKSITHEYTNFNLLSDALELAKNSVVISCFTDDFKYNTPMWAHYTNNYKGFCMEFEIIDAKFIYPVLYSNGSKYDVNNMTNTYLTYILKDMKDSLREDEAKKAKEIADIFIWTFTEKTKVWSYEREYRVFYPNIKGLGTNGFLVSMEDLGLKLKSIYIGSQIEDEYESRLKVIARDLGININKMYVDYEGSRYKLDYKDIMQEL